MRWFALTAIVMLVLAPATVSSQSTQPFITLAIGRIPMIADPTPKVWGMSGMEMITITQPAGAVTPAMRTEMYDARTVEILSRAQAPPLRARDINVVTRNGHSFICVRRYMLLEVLPVDAVAAHMTVSNLANQWTNRIRQVLPQVAPMPSRFGI